ncbi:MAG: alpha/beta hydrolase [Sneathiella sp.]
MTKSRKILLRLVAIFIIFGVIPFTGIYFAQGAFIFPVPAGENPRAAVGGFEPLTLTTPDGETLRAFYHPPAGDGAASVLVFHGNAETAAAQIPRGKSLAGAGFGVLLVEYRGYGGSTGTPSEAGLITDGLTAYDYLRAQSDAPIGLLAFSLGTGVAVPVAAARETFAVVLESPPTSLLDIARYRVGWVPFDFLMKYPFHNDRVISEVDAPILIIHGDNDQVIPVEQGRRLATLAGPGTAFIEIKGAGHNDLAQYGTTAMAIRFFRKSLAAE